ncbi:ClbS/DfsB family four-helix bundle protein [Tenacibaculum ovolyticum]|uniref:ClbS/DfsB family four-helix bundle protein n=1 Tax=Tenacibaculum ovolyticum TaxID=104270 RepID=UPI0022F3D4C1|nr:ClbS/DfsB family four-helix bundle protein [Tenacibaculum ovolyticum]WBX75870.1 ClbS/DfsB family four-helix bundle protein [Tenacibaculum ovolyticum]
MARPKTKEELNNLSEKNFQKLFDLINSLTKEEQISNFLFEDRDKNIRDILVHLFEWHQLLLNWVNSNTSGTESSFLPKPYNWRTYPKLNIEFWKKHQKTPYDESIELLKESHLNAMKVINSFSNDELFIKKHFSWTGTTSLGSYCVSATSSHYDWAIKKIKKHKKTLNK